MNCRPCAIVGQIVANIALMVDHVGNTLLLGDPNETISRRTARARDAGRRWASVACWLLTSIFGAHGDKDHCTYAMDNSQPSIGREVWSWNTDKLD